MRRLNERNKTYVYYALLKELETGVDADGLYTGENIPVYDTPVQARMVVGLTTGAATLQQFGIEDGYAVKVVTDELDCPIDTSSVVWLCLGDVEPYDAEKTYSSKDYAIKDGKIMRYDLISDTWSEVPYTHWVQRVSKSFGYITYLLKEAEVSNAI